MGVVENSKNFLAKKTRGVAGKVADANSKMASLGPAQLLEIENKRAAYLAQKPDMTGIEAQEIVQKNMGAIGIEIYQAYLEQLGTIYSPMDTGLSSFDDESRIRFFDITKWVSDSEEQNLDKLVNVYQVINGEECNVALIYHRTKDECTVTLAIANCNDENQDPAIADKYYERIVSAVRGNFPGVGMDVDDSSVKVGVPECLKEIYDSENVKSVAVLSNIPSEKSKDFISQSMEKLLDGIVPKEEKENYTVVLLARPINNQMQCRNRLYELYTALAPYESWQTTHTYSESDVNGSSATFGAHVGGGIGWNHSEQETKNVSQKQLPGKDPVSFDELENFVKGVNKATDATVDQFASLAQAVADKEMSAEKGKQQLEIAKGKIEEVLGKIKQIKIEDVSKTAKETFKRAGSAAGRVAYKAGEMVGVAAAPTVSLSNSVTKGFSPSLNFGVDFSRTANTSVQVGINDGITKSYTNFGVKHTLEIIERQIKRIEESSALGMWDFASYVISESPVVANNVAHMYLALTQGEESNITRSSVNLWDGEYQPQESKTILENVQKLQHPVFGLKPSYEGEWYLYPTLVTATTSLSGKELAKSLNFPRKSVSGLPVLESVAFGREPQKFSSVMQEEKKINIGQIVHMRHNEKKPVDISLKSLTSHTFITGSTGTGKTTATLQLINKAKANDVKFLVVEPTKGEYKEKIGGECAVYGTNSNITNDLLKINPFWFPKGIHVLEHIDRLIEILNACWPMYAAMPAVLKDAIERAYINNGWNLSTSESNGLYPTFFDLLETLPEVMEDSMYSKDTKSDYSGALMTRVKSLTNGLNKVIFCDSKGLSEEDLFEKNVIVDISRIGGMETKSLIMGVLIMKLQEYWINKGKFCKNLKHLTVLEEAHNILKKTSTNQSQEGSNLQGKSVEMITNAIAEMRAYGEGFVIADQAPNLLDEAVIRNTNTKIVLRLPDADDRLVVGKACSLTDKQIDEIGKLPDYTAVVYQNDWIEAVLCYFEDFKETNEYVKKEITSNGEISINEQKYIKYLFDENGKTELNNDELKDALKWVDLMQLSNTTKRLLRKAFVEGNVDRKALAYNMFQGKNIAKVLEDNYDEEQAIRLAMRKINTLCNINDESLLQNICYLIILQVCEFKKNEGMFAERFRNIAERRLMV